jgi:hypothetical protein
MTHIGVSDSGSFGNDNNNAILFYVCSELNKSCEPSLDDIEEFVHELNKSNNLFTSVKEQIL